MRIFYPTNTDPIKQLPLYLTSVGIYYEETMITRETGYEDFQWIQTISGEGELFFNQQRYIIGPNTGLLIPALIPHSYRRLSDHWVTHWFSFNGQNVPALLKQLELTDLTIIHPNDSSQLAHEMEEIFYLATSNYITKSFKISVLLYQALDVIYASYHHQEQSHPNSKGSQLNTVIDYIHRNYMKDITINNISDSIHVSPQYLCRLFKEQLNLRPFEYVQQVRINKAKSLLLQTPPPTIESIVRDVGFQNPSYFTSTFKKKEAMTPRDFIKLHQRGI